MDLWIRNQSDYTEQKLIKAEQIKVELVIDDIWIINVNGTRVAEYKSRERAVKVLDEVQKFINHFGADQVYQMPLDREEE